MHACYNTLLTLENKRKWTFGSFTSLVSMEFFRLQRHGIREQKKQQHKTKPFFSKCQRKQNMRMKTRGEKAEVCSYLEYKWYSKSTMKAKLSTFAISQKINKLWNSAIITTRKSKLMFCFNLNLIPSFYCPDSVECLQTVII